MTTLDPITVHISIDLDINGVPAQMIYEAPATSQLLDGKSGLLVNLHLDGKKLAHAILPYLAQEIRAGMGIRTPQEQKCTGVSNEALDFARYYRSDHDDEAAQQKED